MKSKKIQNTVGIAAIVLLAALVGVVFFGNKEPEKEEQTNKSAGSITFEENEAGNKAFLSYEFAGQTVGKASIKLEETSEEEFQFSEVESEEGSSQKNDGPKFIMINFKIIFIILAIILLILLFVFMVHKFIEKNRAKIRKAIRIYQRRQFLKRKRYRSRKRRRRR